MKVVVVGGGYAGTIAANRLAKKRLGVEIMVVNPRPDFIERVRLHEQIAGTGVAATPLRSILREGIGRSTPPDSQTPVRSRPAIDRLISRRDTHIQEKTLWRMLYETCARAEELLGVNIEDLDRAGRCCPVNSKGATPAYPPAAHHEYVLDTVYWDAGTARLLAAACSSCGSALLESVPSSGAGYVVS